MQLKRVFLIAAVLTLVFLLALVAAVGCAGDGEPSLEKVTVLLDWTPNTNYSGMYAALEKGYYAGEGLEVEIIQASGYVPQLVAEKKAQFGVSFQEQVTFARLEGIPIVSIAAVISHNTSGFASLSDRGIESPADFENKTYGGWVDDVVEATIRALMEPYGADFNTVELIPTGVDSLIVIERDADFTWIYYGWTGVEAELRGMELNYISLREIDPVLDYYTPVLIASEVLIESDPDLVRRFMRATAKGYRLAIDDPAEAARALLKHAPELDEELVYASQEWLRDRYQAGAAKWGIQERETWENYARWLYDNGLIEEMIDVDLAFTNEFLD